MDVNKSCMVKTLNIMVLQYIIYCTVHMTYTLHIIICTFLASILASNRAFLMRLTIHRSASSSDRFSLVASMLEREGQREGVREERRETKRQGEKGRMGEEEMKGKGRKGWR